MELTGRIIAVLPANSGVSQRTGNAWMSQEYVLEVPGQYPKKCVFRLFGEDRIKNFNIQNGEELTVFFDIDAHEYNGSLDFVVSNICGSVLHRQSEYNGRWFNQISAYNITRASATVQPAAVAGAAAGGEQVATDSSEKSDLPFPATDDLPF